MGRQRGNTIEQPGCWFHDDCLTCSRERCIFEEEGRSPRRDAMQRRGQARSLLAEGKGVEEIAGALQVSRRTAYRYKVRVGEGPLTM